MSRPGIARRRGVSDLPHFPKRLLRTNSFKSYTPPASRSSEAGEAESQTDIDDDGVLWNEQDQGDKRFRNLPADPFARYQYDATFFQREDEEEQSRISGYYSETFRARHRSQRSRDDYGIDYTRYQDRNQFSPPRTPEDDAVSLGWDSHFDPFSSACFRRGSLVLDPAAFDSSPSVNHIPPSPGGSTTLKLKRSTEALKEFGKKVLPKLKIKSRDSHQSDKDPVQDLTRSHKATPSTSSQHNSSSSGRTRSNTIESGKSVRSKTSSTNMRNSSQSFEPLSREHLQDSSDVLSPLATYRSQNGPSTPVLAQEGFGSSLWSSPRSAGPSTPVGTVAGLSPVPERASSLAPPVPLELQKIHSMYNVTDPALEEIMRLMQQDDDSFAAAEASMRHSGWSTENEINALRQRRQEQQNLWQRRLDDALDHAKAQLNYD